MHRAFGVHWYYTWWHGGNRNDTIEFVPMIKGRKDMSGNGSFTAIERLPGVRHLLGYNEPERDDQGNLSVAEALEHWPRLQALASAKNLPLSSPAPSSDARGMAWFEAFMTEAKRRKLKIDMIAMHWYRSRNPDDFSAFIKQLSRSYRLPIWITEFNGWSGSERENYDFLRPTLKFLERERSVERYAYFNPARGTGPSLHRLDGSLSRLGELYRDAGT